MQENAARVCAASEFLLPNPILSFGIVDAGIRSVKSHHDVTNDLETDLMDNNDEDEDGAGKILNLNLTISTFICITTTLFYSSQYFIFYYYYCIVIFFYFFRRRR